MHAEVFKGQLIYVDTQEGKIQLMNRGDNQVSVLNIDADTRVSGPLSLGQLPGRKDWEDLVGNDIDAVVIDGKTKNIYPIIVEE